MESFLWLFSFENRSIQSYRHQFATESLHLCLTIGVISNFIALGLRGTIRIINWNRKRVAPSDNSNSLEENLEESTSPIKLKQENPSTIVKILSCCASIASWFGFSQFAAIPAWYWGFNILSFWVSVLLGILILSVRFLWALFYHNMIKNRPWMIAMGTFIIVYSFGASIFLEGSSRVYNNDTYAIIGHEISTRLIRQWQLPTMCPPGPPCHVYATLAEDTATSVFINAQTSLVHANVSFCWQPANVSLRTNGSLSCANSTRFDLTNVEPKGQRSTHSVYIGNLTADTLYEIQIIYFDSDMDKLSEKYDFVPMDYHHATGGYLAVIENYRTLPDNSSNREITIAMGGDAGPQNASVQITRQVAKYKPDLIVIAGDITYDNGLRSAYYVWDQFLDMFKPIYQQKGHLVPLVLGVGNHDVGKDTQCSATVLPDDENGPLWYLFLPQHSIRGPNGTLIPGVPNITERQTYFYNKVGNLLLVSLDAGYQASMSGEQLKWWKNVNDNHPGYVKMVNYHNPIYWSSDYPTAGNVAESMQTKAGLTYWVPEIDRSGYRSAWENHIHAFKRTFPLKGGLIDPAGTVYLGDGSWGASPNLTPLYNDTGIIATFSATLNQAWIVHANRTNNTAVYTAIDPNGVILDQSTQELVLQKK